MLAVRSGQPKSGALSALAPGLLARSFASLRYRSYKDLHVRVYCQGWLGARTWVRVQFSVVYWALEQE